ncbi:hypothetical protein ACJZ2D_004279 [Fusarium nematophilum]
MTLPSEPTSHLVRNLQALDPSAEESDLKAYTWFQVIIIQDDDLIFGGKALSTLHEENRRRLISGSRER